MVWSSMTRSGIVIDTSQIILEIDEFYRITREEPR